MFNNWLTIRILADKARVSNSIYISICQARCEELAGGVA